MRLGDVTLGSRYWPAGGYKGVSEIADAFLHDAHHFDPDQLFIRCTRDQSDSWVIKLGELLPLRRSCESSKARTMNRTCSWVWWLNYVHSLEFSSTEVNRPLIQRVNCYCGCDFLLRTN